MKNWNDIYQSVKAGEMDEKLKMMGCEDMAAGRDRAVHVLESFKECFGTKEDTPVMLCSAPGRTEICGNHTDHQHGHVLAAAVNLDFLACVALNGTQTVRFQSEGWPMTTVDLSDLKVQEAEKETTASLVRGVLAQLAQGGYEVAGFDMYAVSSVLPGSGLSSSAACEVLLGTAGNHLFCGDAYDAVTIARIGQKAENIYFGKPSEESQIYDSNTYIREYTYLGIIGEIKDGLYRIEQRNKFSVGEVIEIMKPDGQNVEATVEKIIDEDGNEQESAPHPKQVLYVALSADASVYDILRRAEKETE